MNSKLKLGELFLYRDEWKLAFSCDECGLEVEETEAFVMHALRHNRLVSASDVLKLMQQIESRREKCETVAADEDSNTNETVPSLESVSVSESSDVESIPREKAMAIENEAPCPLGAEATKFGVVSAEPLRKKALHKCDTCSKILQSQYALRRHQRVHNPFVCKVCGVSIQDSGNFKVHMKRHNGIKSYACKEPACGKTFVTGVELRLHMRSHSQERPFKCDECEASYKNSYQLGIHRRRHRNERPYICSQCGKAFMTLETLRDHETTHSQERSFACQLCEKSFKRRNALQQHLKLHGEKKYRCQLCDRKFAQHAGLYSHMKSHNNEKSVSVILHIAEDVNEGAS